MDFVFNKFIPENAKKIDGIILCANWIGRSSDDRPQMMVDIKNTIKYFEEKDIPVVIIGQNETYEISYATIAAKEYEFGVKINTSYLDQETYIVNDFFKVELKGSYVDIINKDFFPGLSSKSSPYMFDENHFTEYGADLTINKILKNPLVKDFFNSMNLKYNTNRILLSIKR